MISCDIGRDMMGMDISYLPSYIYGNTGEFEERAASSFIGLHRFVSQ